MTHTFAPPPEHPRLEASDPGLLSAVSSGQARLTPEQGLELLRGATLLSLGRWADASRTDIEALVAQSQKRSAVYDLLTNPTHVKVELK